MKIRYAKAVALIGVLYALYLSGALQAQTFVRYVDKFEIESRTAHTDSALHFVPFPRGVEELDNYPKINAASLELSEVLRNGGELLQVWICGCSSPEGPWEENIRISKERADAAAEYLTAICDIPDYKIVKEYLNEDWYTLYKLVESSDVPSRYDVLFTIRTMQGEKRKQALKKLDGGRVWDYLERELFPQLRGVRFAVFCSKEYQPVHVTDTVYLKDTVVIMKEVYYMDEPQPQPAPKVAATPKPKPVQARQIKIWDTPWLAAVKTDIASDALALPQLGFEVQLSDRLSLEMSGWYSEWPYINACDDHKVYGFRPELRYWMNGTMRKGMFFGVHSNISWYAMMVNDKDFYQNATLCHDKDCTRDHFYEYSYQTEDGVNVTNLYHDTPAWSLGLTAGYSLPLDRSQRWTVEFVAGIGYAHYAHNWYTKSNPWTLKTIESPQQKDYFGITRASVNLTYRFSLRRYDKTRIQ